MATFNYVYENGEVQEFDVNANDIQALDVEDYYDNKNLEDILETLGEANRLYLVENEEQIKKGKAGIYFCDDILDNREDNNVVKRIKDYLNSIVGDLSNLKTNDKTNLVNAINENTSYLKDCAKNIVNINTNGVKKLIQGEILADLDNFLELNTIKSISDITANKPNGVDFASVINLGMQGNNFNQIIADRQGKIFCRGYALWDTPKFKKWQQLATTEITEIGLLNGWEKGYGELKITKTGGVCYLNFQGTVGVSSIGTTIFNIPEGFRPKYQQVFYIPQRDGKPFFGVAIDTNGNVDISGVTSLPTQGAKTDFYMMWRVD